MAVAMCECPLEEEEEEFEDCEELFYCCNCDTLMSNQIGTTDSPWRGTSNLTRSQQNSWFLSVIAMQCYDVA